MPELLTDPAFLAIAAVSLCVFARCLRHYDSLLQFPALISADVAIFLLPQIFIIGRLSDYEARSVVSDYTNVLLLFYCAALAGYATPNWRKEPAELSGNLKARATLERPSRPVRASSSHYHLLIASLLAISAVSFYSKWSLLNLSAEEALNTQPTGEKVKYVFLSNLGAVTFPIASLLYLRHRWRPGLYFAVPEAAFTLYWCLAFGKRGPLGVLVISVATLLWLGRRIRIPRSAFAAFGVVFFLFVVNISTYRSIVLQDRSATGGIQHALDAVGEISISETLDRLSQNASPLDYIDAMNGAYSVRAIDRSGQVDFGVPIWNTFVFQYVPAQLLGRQFKNDLIINEPSIPEKAAIHCGYHYRVGTCSTGPADVYGSFSYAGVLVFFAWGYLARRVWDAAASGSLVGSTLTVLFVPWYLRAFGGAFWGQAIAQIFPVCVTLAVLSLAKHALVHRDASCHAID